MILVALPSDINKALKLAKTASHWMFGCFITATVLTFIMIFLSPWAVSSRSPAKGRKMQQFDPTHRPHHRIPFILFRSLPFTILAFLTALFTVVATVIATAMFIIFEHVFAGQTEVNIKASLGRQMFVFMWIAAGATLVAFILELATSFAQCCCGCRCRRKPSSGGEVTMAGDEGYRDGQGYYPPPPEESVPYDEEKKNNESEEASAPGSPGSHSDNNAFYKYKYEAG